MKITELQQAIDKKAQKTAEKRISCFIEALRASVQETGVTDVNWQQGDTKKLIDAALANMSKNAGYFNYEDFPQIILDTAKEEITAEIMEDSETLINLRE